MEYIWAIGGAIFGAVFAAWRLRGDGTTLGAVVRIVTQDGPRPTVPK